MKKKKKSRYLKLLDDQERDKFQFSSGFQLDLLKYLVQGRDSILVISKVKSSYFTMLGHNIVCEALLRAYKKYKKIPGRTVLLEYTQEMLNTSEFVSLVIAEDLEDLKKIIYTIYDEDLVDVDIIKSTLKQFIAYIEARDLSSQTDFTNIEAIKDYHQKMAKIIRAAEMEDKSLNPIQYMVDDVITRQLQRQIAPDVIPSPFKQINELTNAGGFDKASVIVLLDKAKAKKTFTLMNVARGYLAMQKTVLYIDTENGSSQIMGRMIQSTLKKNKSEILSGEFDKVEKRHMKKYRRLKAEFIVKRISALVDDANTIRSIVEEIRLEKGITPDVMILDYAGKMASISRKKDDFERISDVYVDVQNLAEDLGLDCVWTAHHVTREGQKNQPTRYEEGDISGAISIVRNAQAIFGLNSTPEEREQNIQRMEVVVQRDGKPHGRAVFSVDVEKQYMKELTREQRRAYDESYGAVVDEMLESGHSVKGTSRKRNQTPNADPDKAANKNGDL